MLAPLLARSHLPRVRLQGEAKRSSEPALGVHRPGRRLHRSLLRRGAPIRRTMARPVSETHPERVEWFQNPARAHAVTAGANSQREDFRCPTCKYQWRSTPRDLLRRGKGCPACSCRVVVPGVNDAATTHPERALLFADPVEATRFVAGSAKRAIFRCLNCEHEWSTRVEAVIKRGAGCPVCCGLATKRGVNDLWTTHPERAAILVDPDVGHGVSAGSPRLVDACCAEGHVFRSKVLDLRAGGCPFCSGKRVLPGFNDLATVAPKVASLLVDRNVAATVTRRSHRKVQCRCPEGHEWTAKVVSLRASSCPVCSGFTVVPGVNDIATTHPHRAHLFVEQSWTTRVTSGCPKTAKFRCPGCSHVWSARIECVVRRGQGCPECSRGGYKKTKVGWFYLIVATLDGRRVAQFGISNVPEQRLAAHRGSGFTEEPHLLLSGAGRKVWDLEQAVKREMALWGVPTLLSEGVRFPSHGSSEAFALDGEDAVGFLRWVEARARRALT